MSESTGKGSVLEQYRCRQCRRDVYVNKGDKEAWDLDFGCPFGCDDAGEHTRDIRTEITDVRGV